MREKYFFVVVVILTGIIATMQLGSTIKAQPGTESDPIVSLSYLKGASGLVSVTLEGGEDMKILSGSSIILLSGNSKIKPPDSGSYIVNATTGEIIRSETTLKTGNLYFLIGKDKASEFSLLALGQSVAAVPGITGAGQ